MEKILKTIGLIFAWVTLGFSNPADFSLEDIQTIKSAPAGQFVFNDRGTNESPFLNYINGALVPTYQPNISQDVYKLAFSFRLPATPSSSGINQNASGYYQFSTLSSFTSVIYYGGNKPTIPLPSLAPIDPTTSFSSADMRAWRSYTPAQFVGLGTRSYISVAAQGFLDALNVAFAVRQADLPSGQRLGAIYVVNFGPAGAAHNGGNSYSFPSFIALTQAVSSPGNGVQEGTIDL